MEKFNPYEILGVAKNATTENIKKIFKEKCKKLHPDHGGNLEDFTNLKKAFDILMDSSKRKFYDEYGVDDSFDIENEARLVAIQIVISVLAESSDLCDIDKVIVGVFQTCLNRLKEQEVQSKATRDKLQRRLDSIQKKPANDFLTDEIIKVIESHNQVMKRTQLNYHIHDVALKLVREYKFDVSKISFRLMENDRNLGNRE